jgi:hypothetical protein
MTDPATNRVDGGTARLGGRRDAGDDKGIFFHLLPAKKTVWR